VFLAFGGKRIKGGMSVTKLEKWICEKCDWSGNDPDITESYKFLGTKEEETEEEYIETCPKCGEKEQVILNANNHENQMKFLKAYFG
jgi:Zn finger protein HypA/HybF involved in hydrogenase expression